MTDIARNYVDSRLFQAARGVIRHVRIRPYRPQTNGKAERFNRTLADEWAYERAYASHEERTRTLQDFLIDFNYERAAGMVRRSFRIHSRRLLGTATLTREATSTSTAPEVMSTWRPDGPR